MLLNLQPMRWVRVCLILFVLSLAGLPGSLHAEVPQAKPENIELYFQLFPIVETLTRLPFSAVGLGGADPSQFVNDDLINREELRHTTTFLKIQIIIRQATSPDTVAELRATVGVCEFLLRRFGQVASAGDALGHLAISTDDILRLFTSTSERGRIDSDLGSVAVMQ